MQHYTTLIAVDQLASLMKSNDVHHPLIVFDCRFSLADTELGRGKYETGHIPAAIYVHLDHDLAGDITPRSGRHPLPEVGNFVQRARAWGINSHTQVVVYDDAAGAIAARLWWMMKWIGHTRVALLDGGYAAWRNSGRPISDQVETSIKTERQNAAPAEQELAVKRNENSFENSFIEVDELNEWLKSQRVNLYDARAEPRFAGEHEPIDVIAGHIPGAVNLPFEHNLDEHGFFLGADALKRRFESILTENEGEGAHIVHMCGSGVTACHNILAMEIAGIAPTRLYVGSWSEWIRDPARAVASGQ
ncbi:sulfurtransferase [Candidatus Spongiihabitans sp.]|uniref:sulfurtransferase n=1 Tax=Candidatus Spongiihabitans sp. TaxID=3101308 RepID=UPI003C79D350